MSSQQEINFEEIDHHGSHTAYPGYEGIPQQRHYSNNFSGGNSQNKG